MRELGERLAHLLAGLLRMTRLHSPDNEAFNQPVEELHRTLVRLNDTLGTVHLVAVEDQVYVNDIRIRAGEKVSGTQELCEELRRHNVGEVTFYEPLDGPAIRALVGQLGADAAAEEPRTALVRGLEGAGVSGLELLGRYRLRMADKSGHDVAERHDLIPRALSAIDEAFQNLAAGRILCASISSSLYMTLYFARNIPSDGALGFLWDKESSCSAVITRLQLPVGNLDNLAVQCLTTFSSPNLW